MSFTPENPEIFPLSIEFHILTNVYFQGARCKTSLFYFYPQKSLCSACTIVTDIILLIYFSELSYF